MFLKHRKKKMMNLGGNGFSIDIKIKNLKLIFYLDLDYIESHLKEKLYGLTIQKDKH
jgi:hypothetical protein